MSRLSIRRMRLPFIVFAMTQSRSLETCAARSHVPLASRNQPCFTRTSSTKCVTVQSSPSRSTHCSHQGQRGRAVAVKLVLPRWAQASKTQRNSRGAQPCVDAGVRSTAWALPPFAKCRIRDSASRRFRSTAELRGRAVGSSSSLGVSAFYSQPRCRHHRWLVAIEGRPWRHRSNHIRLSKNRGPGVGSNVSLRRGEEHRQGQSNRCRHSARSGLEPGDRTLRKNRYDDWSDR